VSNNSPLTEAQKNILKNLLGNLKPEAKIGAYKIQGDSRTKALSNEVMHKHLIEECGIDKHVGYVALDYLNELMAEKEVVQNEESKNRITMDTWLPGKPDPVYLDDYDFARVRLSAFDIDLCGMWRFYQDKVVPPWYLKVDPTAKVGEDIALTHIRSGVNKDIRRYTEYMIGFDDTYKKQLSIENIYKHEVESVKKMRTKMKRVEWAKKLTYDPKLGDVEITKLFKLYKAKGKIEHHIQMLKHFLYNIKQILLGRKPVQEVVICFLGLQSIGKGFIIQCLEAAIPGLTSFCTVEQVKVPKNTPKWGEVPIAFFDEISGINKKDLAAFKSWITAPNLSYTPLYTSSNVHVTKITQSIIAIDYPIAQIIKDPNGMRRFYEVPSGQPASTWFKMEYPEGSGEYITMADIDWIEILKSINEDEPRGYYAEGKKHYREIVAIQEAMRHRSSVEAYLVEESFLDRNGKVNPKIKTKKFPVKYLEGRFIKWMHKNHYREQNRQWFIDTLKSHGLEVDVPRASAQHVLLNVPEALLQYYAEKGENLEDVYDGDLEEMFLSPEQIEEAEEISKKVRKEKLDAKATPSESVETVKDEVVVNGFTKEENPVKSLSLDERYTLSKKVTPNSDTEEEGEIEINKLVQNMEGLKD